MSVIVSPLRSLKRIDPGQKRNKTSPFSYTFFGCFPDNDDRKKTFVLVMIDNYPIIEPMWQSNKLKKMNLKRVHLIYCATILPYRLPIIRRPKYMYARTHTHTHTHMYTHKRTHHRHADIETHTKTNTQTNIFKVSNIYLLGQWCGNGEFNYRFCFHLHLHFRFHMLCFYFCFHFQLPLALLWNQPAYASASTVLKF